MKKKQKEEAPKPQAAPKFRPFEAQLKELQKQQK